MPQIVYVTDGISLILNDRGYISIKKLQKSHTDDTAYAIFYIWSYYLESESSGTSAQGGNIGLDNCKMPLREGQKVLTRSFGLEICSKLQFTCPRKVEI